MEERTADSRKEGLCAAAVCAGLLILYGVLTYSAALTKCATFDEPLHVAPAKIQLQRGDFRVNPEDPPLWKYWAALPLLFTRVDESRPEARDSWAALTTNVFHQPRWAVEVLYRTPGNDADAIANRARLMMLLLALGLGALIAHWSYRIGGGIAAVAATCAFALDPNFTAHGALVKNDVAFSLVMLAVAHVLWRVGEEATGGRVLWLALLVGAGVVTKFSGLLLGPLVTLVLLLRAVQAETWDFLGRSLTSRAGRVGAALSTCVIAGIVCYAVIWAAYRFRFSATPDPNVAIGWDAMIAAVRTSELQLRHPGEAATDSEIAAWRPGVRTRAILWAREHRLLPESFLFGVTLVHMASLVRPSYLLGELSRVGWWYYFPLAMLFKTPTATLAAIAGGLATAAPRARGLCREPRRRWLLVCLVVPPAYYLAVAMSANLNLGLRHVFPVYPFVFVGIGLATSALRRVAVARTRRAAFVISMVLLGGGLAAESLSAYPNYIPFFNAPAGGARHGVHLLGDSNLDWGQDLKLLKAWQDAHPDTRLYLAYFGQADPAYYGIRYTNLAGGYEFGPKPEPAIGPGVVAVSATHMQGIYLGRLGPAYAWTMRAEPIEVLGGSIYLFEYPYRGTRRPD